MTFPRSSAELIKNTSTVSPTTLPTVKDALDALGAASPGTILTTLGDLLSYNTGLVRVPVGAADTFLGSTGAAVPSYRTAAQVRSSLNIVTGTYSPTGTIVANLDSFALFGGAGYVRVNDIVVTAGAALADATAGGGTVTTGGISLPVASDFGGVVQCTGVIGGPLGMVGTVAADTTNDRAQVSWASQSTASQTLTYIFLYRII